MASGTKFREETSSDAAREEKFAEPDSVEQVGSPTVPPTQETLAGSTSRGIFLSAFSGYDSPFFWSLQLRSMGIRLVVFQPFLPCWGAFLFRALNGECSYAWDNFLGMSGGI